MTEFPSTLISTAKEKSVQEFLNINLKIVEQTNLQQVYKRLWRTSKASPLTSKSRHKIVKSVQTLEWPIIVAMQFDYGTNQYATPLCKTGKCKATLANILYKQAITATLSTIIVFAYRGWWIPI